MILISGWKKQQVHNEVNNFMVRQTVCDAIRHVALRCAFADVIAYV